MELNTWVSIIITWQASNRVAAVYRNGVGWGSLTNGNTVNNRNGDIVYVSTNGSPGSYFNGDIAGMLVVDELLSLSVATEISNAMMEGKDLTGMTCPTGVPCTQCPAGKHKPNSGNVDCIDCTAGTYSTTQGATTCLTCPVGKEGPVGSTSSGACTICSTGYTGPDGGLCTACVAGKYKYTTGSAACTNCAAGFYSTITAGTSISSCLACTPGTYSTTVGATTCLACPANSDASCYACSASTSCTCNTGYTGPNGGPCTACTTGTYKNTAGSATCTACPANSGSTCSACYTSACPCNAGYTGGNLFGQYSATACARFVALIPSKPSFASVSTRANAGVGTLPTYNALGGPNGKGHISFNRALLQFLDAGPRTWNVATNGGFTLVAVVRFTGAVLASERILDAWSGTGSGEGFLSRSGSTQKIEFDWINKQIQGPFVISSSLFVQDTTWLQIVVTYQISTGILSLNVNGVVNVVTVTPSIPDKTLSGIYLGRSKVYTNRDFNGDMAGVFVVDEYLNTNATTDIINSMMQGVDLTDTACPSGNACTACVAGTYKTVAGSSACTACPAGSTSPVASSSSAACINPACNAGYTGPDGGTCTACVAGKYKTITGSSACEECGFGKYSTNTGATVVSTCLSCPANTYQDILGATKLTDCKSCPSNSKTIKSSGGGNIVACICNAGYTGPDGGPCTACVAGKYKTTIGSDDCTDCDIGTYSTTVGATSADTCLYCDFFMTTTASGSTTCICDMGSYSADGGVSCEQCSPGKYQDGFGSTECINCETGKNSHETYWNCIQCPDNAQAGLVDPGESGCVCNSGYAGNSAWYCTACTAGTYSIGAATTCSACPTNSNSPSASSAAVACTCNAGYTGADGGPCVECSPGSYKSAAGSAACTSCHTFSGATCALCGTSMTCICTGYTGDVCTACVAMSAPASTSPEDCVCGPGLYDANGV
jgi:syndecan 4